MCLLTQRVTVSDGIKTGELFNDASAFILYLFCTKMIPGNFLLKVR